MATSALAIVRLYFEGVVGWWGKGGEEEEEEECMIPGGGDQSGRGRDGLPE